MRKKILLSLLSAFLVLCGIFAFCQKYRYPKRKVVMYQLQDSFEIEGLTYQVQDVEYDEAKAFCASHHLQSGIVGVSYAMEVVCAKVLITNNSDEEKTYTPYGIMLSTIDNANGVDQELFNLLNEDFKTTIEPKESYTLYLPYSEYKMLYRVSDADSIMETKPLALSFKVYPVHYKVALNNLW